MKKNYITPKSLVVDIDFAEIMIAISGGTNAEPGKEVEVKSRIVDFSDEDMF